MYQKNARRRRAAPPSAAALTALAQPPSRVCTPHACLSRHRSSLRLCVSRGVPLALPVLVVYGGFVRRRRRAAGRRGGAPAPRRARQNVSRSPAASLVAGWRHAGQLPLTLSHARMHPAWNACAHAMTRTSCPRSISSQHTRHAEVSRSSPKRDAQSPSPAIHRGSDVIVALDAGPGGSSQVASSTPSSAVGDAAARIAASSPVVRDPRAESIASPSRWTASREAVSPRGDSPERRPRRSRASTRRRRRPRWPSVTNPGSNVSARVPQQQQCTRNTTGRSMNRNTVTVLAASLAEEAEDEDEDTRGLS